MNRLTRFLFGDAAASGGSGRANTDLATASFGRGDVLRGDPKGLSPNNPGSLQPYRVVPAITRPTVATREQMQQMKVKADEMTAIANWTQQAYKAAAQMEKAQTTINKAHFGYATQAAQHTAQSAEAVAQYGQALQQLRGQYAAIAGRYDNAEAQAVDAIRHVELEFYGVLTGQQMPRLG